MRKTPELSPDPIHSAPVVQSKHKGRSVMLQAAHHSLPINLDHFIAGMDLLGAVSRGLQKGKQVMCCSRSPSLPKQPLPISVKGCINNALHYT